MLRRTLRRFKKSTFAKPAEGQNSPLDDFETRSRHDQAKLAFYPHQVLLQKAPEISMEEIKSEGFIPKIYKMNRIAQEYQLMSISAPKIYWPGRVIIVKSRHDTGEYECWINPEIPGYDDKRSVSPMYGFWESCGCCGDAAAWVIRPQQVTVFGLDEYGRERKEVLGGIRARTIMHELDHLNGVSMMHQAPSPDYIVTTHALMQRDQWPPNFPSAEAQMTPVMHFFNYVTNCTEVPKGLEYLGNAAPDFAEFKDPKIE